MTKATSFLCRRLAGALAALRPAGRRGASHARRPIRCRRGTTAPAKQAIVAFVTGDDRPRAARTSCRRAERIATFDQDGTLWVEHPMYSQVMYCLERVPGRGQGEARAGERRAVQDRDVRRPRGDREAADGGPREDPRRDADRHDGRRLQGRSHEVARQRPRTRAGSGPTPSSPTCRCRRCCSTCAPTATRPTSSPAAARTSCACTPSRSTAFRPSRWSAPPAATKYGYDKDGKPFLTKEPKLLLNDNNAGKPEGIHLMIGRRPARRSATRPATADAGVHQGRRAARG